MFPSKYHNRYQEDYFDRKYYSAKIKLKKFDTDEFQSLSYAHNIPAKNIDDDRLEVAVDVKDVTFHYNALNPVLNKISLQVPRGRIYSLLGASGCGKTTLLRIMLGRLKPMGGSVKIFGHVPGSKGSDIPGPGVGYMPQELAIFGLLTINEVLHYYGRLYGMDPTVIRDRVKHFINLLNLPTKHRRVCQLSGGQQRRVSLAVTLIHRPALLILDEPTVGVDSLLRCRIWNYLEELCAKEAATVIITTHYTEEAKGAYRVGFIDSGSLLAQDNPANLLRRFNCISLEDVFLELCLNKMAMRDVVHHSNDHQTIDYSDKNNNNNNNNILNADKLILTKQQSPVKKSFARMDSTSLVRKDRDTNSYFSVPRLNSLLKKNYILFRRNPVSIILLNVLPLFIMFLFSITFARSPRNIPVAIVNHDVNSTNSLSNIFLSKIDNQTLNMIDYPDVESAIQSVRQVKSWLVIAFPPRFSRNFKKRFLKQERVSSKVLEGSKIMMYPDNSHSFFAIFNLRIMLNAFEEFVQQVGSMMGFNPRFFGSPLDIMKPVYGSMEIDFGEYITSGMIISIVHGMAMLIGSFSVVREKYEGHLERGFVAGIKPAEIILSHIIFFILPILSQVVITVSYGYYDINNYEMLGGALVLVFLQALQGMLIGVAISTVVPSELASLIIVFSIEMPLIFTSGVLWPLESLTSTVRYMLNWNPLTLPIGSLRNVTLRGWALGHFGVVIGIVSSLAYSLVALIFSLVTFQIFH